MYQTDVLGLKWERLQCFNESSISRSHSFIRLVDCLVTSSFHQMVVKAAAHVLSVLQQQLCQRPSQSWSHSEPEDGEVRRRNNSFFKALIA